MLGGYYLGQAYLGISGWTASGTLTVQDTTHGHTAGNIALVQQHTLAVADSAHSLATDGNLVLNEYFLLNQPDPGVFLVTSPEISLVQHHTLVIENNLHELVNSIARIINWADYNVFSGIYIKDFSSEGVVEQLEKEYGIVVVNKTQNVDTLVPVTPDTGTFITEFSAFGRYK